MLPTGQIGELTPYLIEVQNCTQSLCLPTRGAGEAPPGAHPAPVRALPIQGDRWRISGPWLLVRALRAFLRRGGLDWSRVLLFSAAEAPPGAGVRLIRFRSAAELPDDPLLFRESALPRFALGDVALAIRSEDGRLACRGWLARGREVEVKEVGQSLELGTGEAWLYDCATHPALRGRGHFPALLVEAAREHLGSGGTRLLVGALDWNRASLRAIRKAGFGPAGVLRRWAPVPREALPRSPPVHAPGNR